MGVVDCDVSTNGSGDANGGTVLLASVVLPCVLRAMLTIRRMTTMAIPRAVMKVAPSIAYLLCWLINNLPQGMVSWFVLMLEAYAIVPVHQMNLTPCFRTFYAANTLFSYVSTFLPFLASRLLFSPEQVRVLHSRGNGGWLIVIGHMRLAYRTYRSVPHVFLRHS